MSWTHQIVSNGLMLNYRWFPALNLCLFFLFTGTSHAWETLAEVIQKAEKGDTAARVELAHRSLASETSYYFKDEVIQAFREGINHNLGEAHAGMARCYQKGYHVDKDLVLARKHAEKAIAMAPGIGHWVIAEIAADDWRSDESRELAEKHYQEAISLGNARAKFAKASTTRTKSSYSPKISNLANIIELAQDGYGPAIQKLWHHYHYTERDAEKADHYYKKCIELGDNIALFDEATKSSRSYGASDTEADKIRALDYLRQAAAQGSNEAIYRLAMILKDDPNLAKEGESWLDLLKQAVAKNSYISMDALGWYYYNLSSGDEPESWKKAAEVLEKCLTQSTQNQTGISSVLAKIYIKGGRGVVANPRKGIDFYAITLKWRPQNYLEIAKVLSSNEALANDPDHKIKAYACCLSYLSKYTEPDKTAAEKMMTGLNLNEDEKSKAQKLADDAFPTKPEHSYLYQQFYLSPEELCKRFVARYKAEGIEAGINELDTLMKQMDLSHGYGANSGKYYSKHFYQIFREAQVRSGSYDSAWAASIYGWMYDRPKSPRRGLISGNFSRISLLNNYLATLHSGGQLAKRKRIIQYWQDSFAQQGYQTDPEKHNAQGNAFPNFPSIRKFHFDQGENPPLEFIDFVGALGAEYFVEGQWKLAMEQFNAAAETMEILYKRGKYPRGTERQSWVPRIKSTRSQLIEGFILMGFDDHAQPLIEDHINQKPRYSYKKRNVYTGKVGLAALKIRHDRIDEVDIEDLSNTVDIIKDHLLLSSGSWHHARCVLIRALFAKGEDQKAWQTLNAAYQKHPKQGNILMLWVEKRIEIKQLDGIEQSLLHRLDAVRKNGHKIYEPNIYKWYARFLVASGRYDEAIRVMHERLRLLEAFDLYTWIPSARLELAVLLAKHGNIQGAEAEREKARQALNNGRPFPDWIKNKILAELGKSLPEGEKAALVAIEIQPVESYARPLHDRPALGLVTLTNPNKEKISGYVSLSGKHDRVFKREDDSGYSVFITPSQSKNEITKPMFLELDAGQTKIVEFITTPLNKDDKGEITLNWKSLDKQSGKALWSYQASEDKGESFAIIDAGVYSANPFHPIPVYNLIQSKNALNEPTNIRIVASHPTRIEIYNESNKLVVIDHNGNGDLNDAGDVLVIDNDRDGLPDLLPADSNTKQSRFLTMVHPVSPMPKDEIELSVQVHEPGNGWVEISKHVINTGMSK